MVPKAESGAKPIALALGLSFGYFLGIGQGDWSYEFT